MRTLILDIETVGENWNALDETTQTNLSRWIERTAKNEEEEVGMLKDLKEGLGFSPLTGKIVAIGVYDLELESGAIYYVGEGDEADEEVDNYILKQRSEKEMLQDFWEGAKTYDAFVSFNGRSFDLPFIIHRSVVCGVLPTRELLKYRYLTQQSAPYHIDLQDELTFYGAMHRRPSLHLFCRAYGIESPKVEGVAGDDVAELFASKKFRDIAMYNSRDVTATKELYQKWLEYLAPGYFLRQLDS